LKLQAEISANKTVLWRMAQDLLGQIWRCLLILSLIAMLQRLNLHAMGMEVASYSSNKADFGGLCVAAGMPSLSSSWRHGGDEKRLLGVTGKYAAGHSGVRMLSSYEDQSRRPEDWQPTQKTIGWSDLKPAKSSASSTSKRRPVSELDAAFNAPPTPSGAVPGAGECGRGSSSCCSSGGRDRGPDCFSNFLSRVFSVIIKGWFVIFFFIGSPVVTGTCTAVF